jgi:saposin
LHDILLGSWVVLQDTQKQILEYAKEACQTFGPDFKDQCLNYVELYGPLVVNMVVQYLKPELCIEAGYCPKPSQAYSLSGTIRSA